VAKFLGDDNVWREIRRRATRSKSLTALVAYVGWRPDRLLKWPKKSILCADLPETAVRQGASSAKGALRLTGRVRLYHIDGLHAKCYLFDRAAVIASANLSSSGAERLREAGVLLTAPHEVKAVRAHIQRVLRDAVPMDPRLLRARARLEPKRPRPRPGQRLSRGFRWGDRVWILVAHEDKDETAAERKAKARWLDAEGYEHNSIDWFNDCGRKIHREVTEKDTVFFWEAPTARRPLGYICGPFISRGGADLDRRLGQRRYALAVQARSLRSVTLDSRRLARLRTIAGYTRSVRHGAAPERVEVPARRIIALARFVGMPLADGPPPH